MNGAVVFETVRRHLTSVGYLAYLMLIALVGVFVSTFNRPASMWPTLVTFLSIITGAAIIGPEFSTAALQLVVSRPVRRSTYVISRVAGVLASLAIAALTGASVEGVARLAFGSESVPWLGLASAAATSLGSSLLAVSLLAMLGSMTRSYFNVAIYAGAQVALTAAETIVGVLRTRARMIGDFLEDHAGIERALIAIDDLLFPSLPQHADAQWLMRVAITASIALVIACVAFERREVPYGGD